jgi:mRNA interferase YafQ
MKALREVMGMLFYGDPLPPEYLDHELTGAWAGHRECHIGGDFLLIYRSTSTEVYFVDIGTHAELFR